MLTNLALVHLILTAEVQFIDKEQAEMDSIISDSDRLSILLIEFKTGLDKIESNKPTSRLWMQYFRMIALLKRFIQAERMEN